jgi:hypothetical protein
MYKKTIFLVISILTISTQVNISNSKSLLNDTLKNDIINWYQSENNYYDVKIKKKQVVGIITDGIDVNNKEVNENIISIYNPIKEVETYKPKDYYIGSTIASLLVNKNNNTPLLNNTKLIYINTSNPKISDSDISKHILYLINKNVKAIQISLGIKETTISQPPNETCKAIKTAKKHNIPTFIPISNLNALSDDYLFDLRLCSDAYFIGGYDQNLNNISNENNDKEFLSAPAESIIDPNYKDGYQPYITENSNDWATTFVLASYIIINSKNNNMSKTIADLSKYSFSNQDNRKILNLKSSYIRYKDDKSFLYNHNKNIKPKIISYNRDDKKTAVSWSIPYSIKSDKIEVKISYKVNNKWNYKKQILPKEKIRTEFNFKPPMENYVTITAISKNKKYISLPYSNLIYTPYVEQIPEDYVISSRALWIKEGVQVEFESNYIDRMVDITVIDVKADKIIRKYKTSNKEKFIIPFPEESEYRDKLLLIATGSQDKGVDLILNPQYEFSIKTHRIDKNTIAITGSKTIDNKENLEGKNYYISINNNYIIEVTIDSENQFTKIINYYEDIITVALFDGSNTVSRQIIKTLK